MRVTNSMIYGNALSQMQSTLADYMESNIQGGTQKKINKPSDDPAGAALVLNTRVDIASTEQYQRNIDTARGWLEMTDGTLQEVSTTIASIKTLAEQAATSTMSPENRQQIAYQLDELFGQLLNLSNVEFENNSIFGGHEYTDTAFEQGLTVNTTDANFDIDGTSVTGAPSTGQSSTAVRFLTTGDVGTDVINYTWSNDGGDTWHDGTLNPSDSSINMDGVTLNMRPGTSVIGATNPDVVDSADGTMLYVHPTGVYQGDDNNNNAYGAIENGPAGLQTSITGQLPDNTLLRIDGAADVATAGSIIQYSTSTDGGLTWVAGTAQVSDPATGTIQLPFTDANNVEQRIEIDATNAVSTDLTGMTIDMQPRRVDTLSGSSGMLLDAEGAFTQNTMVRMDENTDLTVDGAIVQYSYSTDNGNTWIKATSQNVVDPISGLGTVRLSVPGGSMEISTAAGGPTTMTAGTQMIIHPERADLGYEIMANTYVPVNQVGKDIFGGMYNGKTVEGPNLFDAVGELIACCEFNDSDGIGRALETITAAHEHVETEHTRIGGLTNRLDLAEETLDFEKIEQQERLSYTEDIDLTTLLNNLAKHELAYSTVLQTSSMIMQLNLTKYV